MRAELLAHLRPEFTAKLDRFAGDTTHVEEGVLRGTGGAWWPVVRGVPCFLTGELRPGPVGLREEAQAAEPRRGANARPGTRSRPRRR